MGENEEITLETAFETGCDMQECEGWIGDKLSAFKDVIIKFGTTYVTKPKIKKLFDMIFSNAAYWTTYTGTNWDDLALKAIKDGFDANWDAVFDELSKYLGLDGSPDIVVDPSDVTPYVFGDVQGELMTEVALASNIADITGIDINKVKTILTVVLQLIGLFF